MLGSGITACCISIRACIRWWRSIAGQAAPLLLRSLYLEPPSCVDYPSLQSGTGFGFIGGLVSTWRTDAHEVLLLTRKFPALIEHHGMCMHLLAVTLAVAGHAPVPGIGPDLRAVAMHGYARIQQALPLARSAHQRGGPRAGGSDLR